MSQENVEVVGRALAAFNRRDLEALAKTSHDDIEFVSVLSAVEAGTARFHGHAGWTQYFEVMDQTWQDWTIDDIQLVDAGQDRVVAICSIGGRGRLSGVQIGQTVGITYRLREGKMWRIRSYPDPAEALAAMGLEE